MKTAYGMQIELDFEIFFDFEIYQQHSAANRT